MDLNNYKVDVNKNNNGVWIDLDEKSSLLVARAGNKKYNSFIRKQVEAQKKHYRNAASMPEKLYDNIVNKALSKFVLLDWKGLTIDGKEVKHSEKKCLEIFEDERFEEFRAMIIELGCENDRFREETKEDAKDNLKKS